MDTIDLEVSRLAQGIRSQHNRGALSLACLAQLTASCFKRLEQVHHCDLSLMRDLQHQAILALAAKRGVDPADLTSSLSSLDQASKTVKYLSTVPN